MIKGFAQRPIYGRLAVLGLEPTPLTLALSTELPQLAQLACND